MMSFLLFFVLIPCLMLAWAAMGVITYLLLKRIGFISDRIFQDESDTDKTFILVLWPMLLLAMPFLFVCRVMYKLYLALLEKFDK